MDALLCDSIVSPGIYLRIVTWSTKIQIVTFNWIEMQ